MSNESIESASNGAYSAYGRVYYHKMMQAIEAGDVSTASFYRSLLRDMSAVGRENVEALAEADKRLLELLRK